MYRVVVLALCACNQVFGSDAVRVVDAHYFDAPIDGPTHCPAFGQTPVFSPQLHAVIAQDCHGYQISSDRGTAIAECNVAGGGVAIFEGPQDQPLTQVSTLPVSDDNTQFDVARLSPEGDLIFLTSFDLTTTMTSYRSYTRDAMGWTQGADLPFPQFNTISPPSRGPDRRIIVYESKALGHEFHEDANGQWSELRLVTIGSDGHPHIVYLSPDALRIIVFEGGVADGMAQHTLYADRANRDSDFSPLVELSAIPPSDVFVTEDCGRVYVDSVKEIFFALGE
jgi:hypothetical protein